MKRTKCHSVESRGPCFICGREVLTTDSRYKPDEETDGKYTHRRCQRRRERHMDKMDMLMDELEMFFLDKHFKEFDLKIQAHK